ncbi:hypothetical protein ES332_D10G127700v1 [Gossypium tomentosum]|uniref:Uncharacterized protein n=1 Tax=Gossypium tomentosum TaxID=34277 RepID=A0A5D2J4W9_GOSTO|nr:hypothetical protein ES332_D10G127700v1 [Gossypium tomentosum]
MTLRRNVLLLPSSAPMAMKQRRRHTGESMLERGGNVCYVQGRRARHAGAAAAWGDGDIDLLLGYLEFLLFCFCYGLNIGPMLNYCILGHFLGLKVFGLSVVFGFVLSLGPGHQLGITKLIMLN